MKAHTLGRRRVTRRRRPVAKRPGTLRQAEMVRLFRLVAAGDAAARERLITSNLNLVRHVVHRYRFTGQEFEELFQVGCVGLVKAVDRFDLERGTRFSTYAVPLILGEVQRHLRDQAPPGLGRGALALAQRARRAEDALSAEFGRAATADEVAAKLGVSMGDLALALEAGRRPASLDEGAGSAEGHPWHERLAAPGVAAADTALLRTLLGRLEPRERMVLVLRYFRDRSQAEVGALLGLSQPQVSRVEKRALQALRQLWQGPPPT